MPFEELNHAPIKSDHRHKREFEFYLNEFAPCYKVHVGTFWQCLNTTIPFGWRRPNMSKSSCMDSTKRFVYGLVTKIIYAVSIIHVTLQSFVYWIRHILHFFLSFF